jgi:hypothetical protein
MKTEFNNLHGNFNQESTLLLFILCSFTFLVAILLLSNQTLALLISSKVFFISEEGEDQLTKSKIVSAVNTFIIIKQAYAQKQDIENNNTAITNTSATTTTTTNNNNETTSTIKYIKTAAQLLGQVSTEYKNGNFSKADELATKAYLDNFEYVEPILEKHGAKNLMEEIEHMMRTEIRDMIKNKVSQDKLDLEVGTIRGKLLDAISVLESSSKRTVSTINLADYAASY